MTRTEHTERKAARAEASQTRRVRTDIQGLRAVAVVAVLIYHLTPQGLSGGYIGVDVFFVISGFLITTQLLRELESTGTVRLGRFWARRARRLLPAALLVLVVTLIAVWIITPSGFVPSFLIQIAASAAYVQNWVLAGEAVDYMANEGQVSPVQHYWTLSVEEQFYILWPLVAVAAAVLVGWIAKRRAERPDAQTPRTRADAPAPRLITARAMFGILIGAVAVASFASSIITTAFDPARAYFVTDTRAWEFAVGGLLALAATSPAAPLDRLSPRLRSLLAWIGLVGILAAALWFTDSTPFPGYTALLPVVATALVVVAGEPETRWSPRAMLAAKPMQWLGDVSYGVYLWHFPLIVLAPFVLGRSLVVGDWILVTAATLLLAWASKELVEDPFRQGISRSWSNGRTLIITSTGMAVVLAGSVAGFAPAEQRIDDELQEVSERLQDPDPCVGATALDPDADCEVQASEDPIPDPALVDKIPERCIAPYEGSEVEACEYGADPDEAERVVALVGDSHAEQWMTALKPVAEREDWQLVVMAKASCPFTAATRDFVSISPEAAKERQAEYCSDWNANVMQELEEREVDTVITSAKATNRIVAEDDEEWRDAARQGYIDRWAELSDSVRDVIAIKDTPQMTSDLIECVTEHGENATRECAVEVDEAFPEDPLAEAAEAVVAGEAGDSELPGVSFIDLTDYFVADEESPPVIGGVLAFRDSHHVSWAYAEMLADPLAERVEEAIQ